MKRTIIYTFIVLLSISCNNQVVTHHDPVPKHDSLLIYSSTLEEDRVINIWTPPTYSQSNNRFPVIYMPDGGIKEDFPHIANTLAKLIEENKIPPSILVGIENTERGRDLTGYSEAAYDEQFCPLSDGAKNFRNFISYELIPEINRKYRSDEKKGIIGESLAGLFVMETFFISPETFNFYIAMDPSLWWNDHFLVQNVDSLLAQLPDNTIKLWFAGSGAEDISKYTRSVEKSLQKKAPKNLIWKYSDEADEKHNTIFRATKDKALIWSLSIDN